jgi:hypothetical protein
VSGEAGEGLTPRIAFAFLHFHFIRHNCGVFLRAIDHDGA